MTMEVPRNGGVDNNNGGLQGKKKHSSRADDSEADDG